MSACLPVLPPLLGRLFKLNTNNLTWLRPRPSTTLSHPTTTTYNASTWPGSCSTPVTTTPTQPLPWGPRKQLSTIGKFHRLYDVGNLLGTPPPPPGGATLLPTNLLVDGDDDEGLSCTEMENQSDPESLRNIRISKGWHRTKAGTFAPPSSPRG